MQLNSLKERLISLENTQMEMILNIQSLMRLNQQPVYEYVSLTDFGYSFRVSIGSKTMGNLLKLVGLAQSRQGKTVPYRADVPYFCTSGIVTGRTNYYWHYDRCREHIDNWLRDEQLFEKFYGINDKTLLCRFINDLYREKSIAS